MNVIRIANVDGHSHCRVCQLQRIGLGLADLRPVILRAGVVVGDLHKEEWKIAFRPGRSPISNERLKEAPIDGKAQLVGVRLALIPDDSADGKARQRSNHAVVESRGSP